MFLYSSLVNKNANVWSNYNLNWGKLLKNYLGMHSVSDLLDGIGKLHRDERLFSGI